jgi:molybdopterin-guanine dinucleotide biosynthesis adapter protein
LAAVIAIVGKSKTGKTTLIEKLIPELKSRGYHIATVKHTFHTVDFDIHGTDTWRHIQAGSEAVVLSSADSIIMIKRTGAHKKVEDAISLLGENFDIVIVEGFKESDLPKIEVHRREKGIPLSGLKNLLAIATDERLDTPVPQYSLSDAKGIADLIQDKILTS